MKKSLLLFPFFITIAALPLNAYAQDSFEQKMSIVKARVVEIVSERKEDYEDIDGSTETATIQIVPWLP